MRRRIALALLLLLGTVAGLRAQSSGGNVGNTVLVRFTGAPSGACLPNQEAVNNATSDFYICNTSFVWVKVGSGGGGGTIGGAIASGQLAGGTGTNTIGPAGLWTFGADAPSTLGCIAPNMSDNCNIQGENSDDSSFILGPGVLYIDDPSDALGLMYGLGVLTLGTNGTRSGQLVLLDVGMTGSVTLGEVAGKEFNLNGAGLMSATASNTDINGTVTNSGGTGTYSFTRTFSTAPICIVQDDTTIASLLTKTVTTTQLTVTTTGMTDHWSYVCVGRS